MWFPGGGLRERNLNTLESVGICKPEVELVTLEDPGTCKPEGESIILRSVAAGDLEETPSLQATLAVAFEFECSGVVIVVIVGVGGPEEQGDATTVRSRVTPITHTLMHGQRQPALRLESRNKNILNRKT